MAKQAPDRKPGDIMRLDGYDVVALLQCDHGFVVVLNNNGDHYLVAETDAGGAAFDAEGRFTVLLNTHATFRASFRYHTGFAPAYRAALAKATEIALADTSDIEACPGCGCMPGDGTTVGCDDPDGCGYFAAQRIAEAHKRGDLQ